MYNNGLGFSYTSFYNNGLSYSYTSLLSIAMSLGTAPNKSNEGRIIHK